MATTGGTGPIKTAGRVFAILETLDEVGEATLTELARRLDTPRSTVYDHLSTMVDEGFLVKEEQSYRLSLRFLSFGMTARERIRAAPVVQPALERLAEETGEIAWFLVEEDGLGVYLNKAKGRDAVQPYGKVGNRVHLHDIAAGKAILAWLPPERVSEIVDRHGLPGRTDRTITDREALFAELEAVRERGVAFNDCESMERFRAVASPIVTGEEVHGSIVVSGPETRLEGERFERELPDLVSGTANAVALTLLSE
jgi:DNA-binding IclR family transcriptional regulator